MQDKRMVKSIKNTRYQEARNICRDGELMGVDMLLLESQVIYLTPN